MSDSKSAGATSVEVLTEFKGTDLNDICDAAEAAIADGGGFGWVKRPPRNNEAQAFAGQLTGMFVAPWARNRGLGRQIAELAEMTARELGVEVLNLDVRDTQDAAIRLFESLGYRRWGQHPAYARVEGKILSGHFLWKPLTASLRAEP